MLPGLTLIVLGQTFILGSSPNATAGGAQEVFIPGINQPLHRNVTRRDDYTYTPGIGGHKVHTEVAAWSKALRICRDEGGHLAVINSQEEANAIARLLVASGPHANSYAPNTAWIGIHDLVSQEGDWETVFGDLLPDAGYDVWQEEKSTGGAHCGAVHQNSRLGWLSCARRVGFVCEILDGQSCGVNHGVPPQEAAWWIRESLRKVLSSTITPSQV